MASQPSHAPSALQHVVGFDVLRIVAIMSVLLFHRGFWGWASPDSATIVNYGHTMAFPNDIAFTHFGWVGVNIFFVLSGFLIASSASVSTPSAFLKSRLVRLLPGFILCLTIALALLLAFGKVPAIFAVLVYITSIIFLPFGPWIDGVLWTLSIEIAFYALVFWILKNEGSKRLVTLITCIGLISSAFWLYFTLLQHWPQLSPDKASLMTEIANSQLFQIILVQTGCFFALGALVWHMYTQPTKKHHYLNICMLLIGCLLAIYGDSSLKAARTGLNLNPYAPMLVWLAAMAGVVISIRYNQILSRWLQALPMRNLGLATYVFYLLHENLGVLTFNGLLNLGFGLWLGLIINGVLILAISYMLMHVAERPLQRRFKAYLS